MNILTDEEIESCSNFSHNRYQFARAIEAAVLKKLAEQDVEPVAFTNEAQLGYVTSGQHPDIPLAMWSCNTSYAGASIKLYTETQLIAAQQRTAEACAKAAYVQSKYFGYNAHAEAVRDAALNKWREYL